MGDIVEDVITSSLKRKSTSIRNVSVLFQLTDTQKQTSALCAWPGRIQDTRARYMNGEFR